MASTTIHLSDVTIDAAAGLIQTLGIGLERPRIKWRASVAWKGGFSASTAIPSGGHLTNARETMLDALGTCVAIGLATDAALEGVAIANLRIDLDGDVDLRSVAGDTAGDAVAAVVILRLAPIQETVDEVLRRAG